MRSRSQRRSYKELSDDSDTDVEVNNGNSNGGNYTDDDLLSYNISSSLMDKCSALVRKCPPSEFLNSRWQLLEAQAQKLSNEEVIIVETGPRGAGKSRFHNQAIIYQDRLPVEMKNKKDFPFPSLTRGARVSEFPIRTIHTNNRSNHFARDAKELKIVSELIFNADNPIYKILENKFNSNGFFELDITNDALTLFKEQAGLRNNSNTNNYPNEEYLFHLNLIQWTVKNIHKIIGFSLEKETQTADSAHSYSIHNVIIVFDWATHYSIIIQDTKGFEDSLSKSEYKIFFMEANVVVLFSSRGATEPELKKMFEYGAYDHLSYITEPRPFLCQVYHVQDGVNDEEDGQVVAQQFHQAMLAIGSNMEVLKSLNMWEKRLDVFDQFRQNYAQTSIVVYEGIPPSEDKTIKNIKYFIDQLRKDYLKSHFVQLAKFASALLFNTRVSSSLEKLKKSYDSVSPTLFPAIKEMARKKVLFNLEQSLFDDFRSFLDDNTFFISSSAFTDFANKMVVHGLQRGVEKAFELAFTDPIAAIVDFLNPKLETNRTKHQASDNQNQNVLLADDDSSLEERKLELLRLFESSKEWDAAEKFKEKSLNNIKQRTKIGPQILDLILTWNPNNTDSNGNPTTQSGENNRHHTESSRNDDSDSDSSNDSEENDAEGKAEGKITFPAVKHALTILLQNEFSRQIQEWVDVFLNYAKNCHKEIKRNVKDMKQLFQTKDGEKQVATLYEQIKSMVDRILGTKSKKRLKVSLNSFDPIIMSSIPNAADIYESLLLSEQKSTNDDNQNESNNNHNNNNNFNNDNTNNTKIKSPTSNNSKNIKAKSKNRGSRLLNAKEPYFVHEPIRIESEPAPLSIHIVKSSIQDYKTIKAEVTVESEDISNENDSAEEGVDRSGIRSFLTKVFQSDTNLITKYFQVFVKEQFDLKSLLTISDQDLIQLQFPMAHRKLLLSGIEEEINKMNIEQIENQESKKAANYTHSINFSITKEAEDFIEKYKHHLDDRTMKLEQLDDDHLASSIGSSAESIGKLARPIISPISEPIFCQDDIDTLVPSFGDCYNSRQKSVKLFRLFFVYPKLLKPLEDAIRKMALVNHLNTTSQDNQNNSNNIDPKGLYLLKSSMILVLPSDDLSIPLALDICKAFMEKYEFDFYWRFTRNVKRVTELCAMALSISKCTPSRVMLSIEYSIQILWKYVCKKVQDEVSPLLDLIGFILPRSNKCKVEDISFIKLLDNSTDHTITEKNMKELLKLLSYCTSDPKIATAYEKTQSYVATYNRLCTVMLMPSMYQLHQLLPDYPLRHGVYTGTVQCKSMVLNHTQSQRGNWFATSAQKKKNTTTFTVHGIENAFEPEVLLLRTILAEVYFYLRFIFLKDITYTMYIFSYGCTLHYFGIESVEKRLETYGIGKAKKKGPNNNNNLTKRSGRDDKSGGASESGSSGKKSKRNEVFPASTPTSPQSSSLNNINNGQAHTPHSEQRVSRRGRPLLQASSFHRSNG